MVPNGMIYLGYLLTVDELRSTINDQKFKIFIFQRRASYSIVARKRFMRMRTKLKLRILKEKKTLFKFFADNM